MTDAVASLAALFRPELDDLKPYVPHVPAGIRIRLDANEAPPSSSPAVREAVKRGIAEVALERYPDPLALRLKDAIAKRTGARAEELILGSGSDENIALVLTALARPRAPQPQPVVLTPTPTFVMYRVTARTHGQKPVEVPLDASWDLDVAMTTRAIQMMRPNVVFIASPNNPTGNRMSDDRLRAVLDAADGAFVILDEAYVDYAPASLRGLRAEYPALGVLRTLSKVGLAALRIGWLEAAPAIIAAVDKVRQPFNLSATSQAAGAAVLEDAWDDLQADVARVVRAREELARAVSAIEGCVVTPSGANFLWMKTPRPAEEVSAALVREGILVRSFHAGGGRLAHQLRVTIGTDAENEAFLAALSRALGVA